MEKEEKVMERFAAVCLITSTIDKMAVEARKDVTIITMIARRLELMR